MEFEGERSMGLVSRIALAACAIVIFTATQSFAEWGPGPESGLDEQPVGDAHWLQDDRSQCWAFDSRADFDDSMTWSGDCRDGKIWGRGTLTFFNRGRMFETVAGMFDRGMLQSGHVSIVWGDGSHYDGEQRDG